MTYKEETYILKTIKEIHKEVSDNNVMLKQLISIVNKHINKANQENIDDFGRNVLANIISSTFDIKKLRKR